MKNSVKKIIVIASVAAGTAAIAVTGIHFALKKFRKGMECLDLCNDTDWFMDGCQGQIDV